MFPSVFEYIKVSEDCVKSIQIRSYFWSVFSCIRTEHGDLRSKFALISKLVLIKSYHLPCALEFLYGLKSCRSEIVM